jgi:hypothetical protein
MPADATTINPILRPTYTYYRRFEAASTDTLPFLRALDALLTLENYNGFTLQATPQAHRNAKRYLENASYVIHIPMPEFTPDGEGGIDIEWENNGRHLALSCRARPDNPDFISWREPQGRYDGRPANQALLNERLEWLLS